MSDKQFPFSQPYFETFADFLEWFSCCDSHDGKQRRKDKISPVVANPSLPNTTLSSVEFIPASSSPAHRRVMVIHDFRGGYLPYEQFENVKNESDRIEQDYSQMYTFRWWAYCSHFVYFSHKFLALPPEHWLRQAKRAQVPIYGTLLIREWEQGMLPWLTDIDGDAGEGSLLWSRVNDLSCSIARATIEISGGCISGLFLDLQCALGPSEKSRQVFLIFVSTLCEALRRCISCQSTSNREAGELVDAAPLLILWDSFGMKGEKSALHGVYKGGNADILSTASLACGGKPPLFVMDYGRFSAQTVEERCLAFEPQSVDVELAQCVDVFGRGGVPGELSTAASCAECLRRRLVPCLFAPAWSAEKCDGSAKSFLELDDALWKPIAEVLTL